MPTEPIAGMEGVVGVVPGSAGDAMAYGGAGRSRSSTKQIVDIGGGVPALSSFWFLGVAGSTTLKGYFVDESGTRRGSAVSLSINAAGSGVPVNLNDVGIPRNTTGFVGNLAAACYIDTWEENAYSPDFDVNYANYPVAAANNDFRLGRATAFAGGVDGLVGGSATPAGEAHVGQVGGTTLLPSSNIVMSAAGAYVTGDYVGTTTAPQAFANAVRVSGGKGVVKSIVIEDNTTTAAVALELWLFSATFTAPTDSTAWAITDAHRLLCVGVIPIGTSKWYADSNGKVYSDDTLSLPIGCAATSLFYALVARGTNTTWASLDLTITLGILAD